MNSLTSLEGTQGQPKEIAKYSLVGKIINAFSELEVSLHAILKKSGRTDEYLQNRRFSVLVKTALFSGILTTSDIDEISQIQKIRNSVVHGTSQATQKDVEYVEKFAAYLVQKLSKMKTVTTPPIKIELSVHTDFFQDDYALVIDGNVSMMLPNVPVTVLITEPNGNIVYISQLEIDTKGRFGDTHNINKSLWQKSGKYTITATYGADENNATRIIDYKTTEPELINELQVNASGKFHTVDLMQNVPDLKN